MVKVLGLYKSWQILQAKFILYATIPIHVHCMHNVHVCVCTIWCELHWVRVLWPQQSIPLFSLHQLTGGVGCTAFCQVLNESLWAPLQTGLCITQVCCYFSVWLLMGKFVLKYDNTHCINMEVTKIDVVTFHGMQHNELEGDWYLRVQYFVTF